MGCLLAQENDLKEDQTIYYLSRCLLDVERCYSTIERLCLALYCACTKLRYYILFVEMSVVCKIDHIKYMLLKPVLMGRIGRWMLTLSNPNYVPTKVREGQAIADFLANHPCVEVEGPSQNLVGLRSWTFYFDRSRTFDSVGAGIVIRSLEGKTF